MVPSGSLELFLFVLLVITTHSALGNQDTKSTADPDNNEGKPKIYYYLENSNDTVEDGQKITQNFLGEHKVITPEQQFLGVILSFFTHLR